MSRIPTVCTRDCYDTCALIFELGESGQIVSIRGDRDHPVTRGFTCPRGAKDHERLYRNRVQAPGVRGGDSFRPTDWETALATVSRRLRETLETHGPEGVLHLSYDGNSGLLTGTFSQRLWVALGATQTDYALCSSSGHAGLALHYGDSHGMTPTELLSTDLIVFWGFNAAASSPHLWSLARKARRTRGARIAVIDPRESRTAKGADLWVQPRPGSDVALAYGIIGHLIENNQVDLGFVREHTRGFAQLETAAGQWPLDRTARFTGVPREQIERLARAYALLRPSATLIGIGLQKNDRGADQVRAAAFLPALLGLHRGFFYSNTSAFSVDRALLSGQTLAGTAPRIVPQVALADLIQQGRFQFVFISGMNPAMTLPNQHALREGLVREDTFVVVHETHWTKTAHYADVVLPAPSYLEKHDLVIPWSHPYVQRSNQIVDPVTDSRSEVWVMQSLARRLGLTQDWLYQDAWEAVHQATEDAFEHGSLESLEPGERLVLKRKPRDRYPTPSGKIEFYSSRATAMGCPPLPRQAALPTGRGRFVLLTSATPHYTNTQFQEVYGPIPAIVTVNPHDAERLGIEDGQVVTLSNERGQIRLKAALSETVPQGVLWSPRQAEGLAGEPQNGLTGSEPQEIGRGPRFNSTLVDLSGSC